MRKILIIVIFLLNIIFCDNVKSQCNQPMGYNYYGPTYSGGYLPNANGSGTTPSWWTNFTTWMSFFGVNVGQLFNQNTPPPSPLSTYGSSLFGSWYFNQYQNNNQILSGGGSSSGTSGVLDCFGVDGGTAKTDVCGACVGGTTGADSCNKPNANDTLKPVKIPCLPDAVARDTLSDYILDYIKDSAAMKNARDSAPFRKFEVGFSISRYSNPTGTAFSYQPKNYNKTGASQSVPISHYASAVADLHIHPDSTSKGTRLVESPSPVDFGGLIENYLDPYFNKKFHRRFIVSGGTFKGEYALVVSDTAKLRQFNLLHPFDSTFNKDPNSPTQGNWKGSDSSGLYKDYLDAYKKFKEEGYPKSMLETYANVYLLETQNLGIVVQQKIDGKFKELRFVEEYVSGPIPGTSIKHYRIKICE